MATVKSSDDELLTTFGRLAEAYGRVERLLAQSLRTEAGVPRAWFEVLMRLSRSPGQQLMMSTLADQIALTTGGITRLIDRMAAAGYVERTPCATDRRVSYANMTESGRQVLERTIPLVVENLRDVFGEFGTHDLSRLDDLLDRLRQAG